MGRKRLLTKKKKGLYPDFIYVTLNSRMKQCQLNFEEQQLQRILYIVTMSFICRSRERHSQTCKNSRNLPDKQCPQRSINQPRNESIWRNQKMEEVVRKKQPWVIKPVKNSQCLNTVWNVPLRPNASVKRNSRRERCKSQTYNYSDTSLRWGKGKDGNKSALNFSSNFNAIIDIF